MAQRAVLCVLSSGGSDGDDAASAGVSALGFMQAHDILERAGLQVVVATPDGRSAAFACENEAAEEWVAKERQLVQYPLRVGDAREGPYCGLLIPSALSALNDLAQCDELGSLVQGFLEQSKPVCAIGYGVAGLFRARARESAWSLRGWNITGSSNFEQARFPWFGKVPVVMEDFIIDNGGMYNASECDAVHVIVDRTLVTGQNVNSTAVAVHALVALVGTMGLAS